MTIATISKENMPTIGINATDTNIEFATVSMILGSLESFAKFLSNIERGIS
jgi:hypothetical protein